MILSALKKYKYINSTPVMFEYIMLKDLNDSDENAMELSRMLKNFPCKINLIPFNEIDGVYSRSKISRINKFAKLLNDSTPKLRVLIRWSKGEDIEAACGQLATKNEY